MLLSQRSRTSLHILGKGTEDTIVSVSVVQAEEPCLCTVPAITHPCGICHWKDGLIKNCPLLWNQGYSGHCYNKSVYSAPVINANAVPKS